MYIRLFALIFCIFNIGLLAGEVSVFGAGNLESATPYGLTDSEKVILKNKNKLTKFDRKIDDTRSNIDVLSERIDGIESIVDGDSRKLNSTSNKLSKLILEYEASQILINSINEKQEQSIEEINTLKEEITTLRFELNKSKETLNSLIKQINKDYVTKKQFDELVVFINKQFSKKSKIVNKTAKQKFTKSKKILLNDAKKLFKKDYFTKAIPIFEYLIEKKYRPAESNFYLGEIWFHRKKYADAISYFKTSMTLYDQAKYIPVLLLHSAISFEKTKDLDNASNFYGTLIDVYPDTAEAKEAQKNLAKLN